MIRRFLHVALLGALMPSSGSAQTRPAVRPADYGRWESLGAGTLAPNGQWLAYAVNRVNEEHELRLGGVRRDTTIAIAYASAPAFTGDSRWLAYAVGVSPAERERLTREKKPIRNAVGIRNMTTGATEVVKDVSQFRFSADGRFIAMRRYPAEGKRAADMIVQDLARGTKMTFGNVTELAWAERGALLAFAIETDGGVGNGVHLYDAATGMTRVLDSAPSLYRMLAWRERSEDFAVLRSRTEKEFRDTTHVVLAWTRVAAANAVRRELDPAKASGFPSGMRIAEHRRPEWSRDGSIIYFGLRPRQPAPPRADSAVASGNRNDENGSAAQRADTTRTKSADKLSDVQVWHAKDVRIMPMQKAQEQQDLQRTLLTAWHLGDAHVVQIGTDLLETARVLRGDRHATETDRKPYAFGAKFGRPYSDVYVVDVKTGQRRKALEKVRYFYGGSPTGQKLAWYDGKDYWAQDVATGARTNLTAKVSANFADPDYDYPGDLTPPAGYHGWMKDDRALIVADEFDLWSLAPDGSGGRRLTNGAADNVIHRYARITRNDDEGIDPAAFYVALDGKLTKQSGYARVRGSTTEQLVFEDAGTSRLIRADSSDVFAFTRERFDDSPDWFVGNGELRGARQVSATNPFQKDFAWGRAELVNYRTVAGLDLQGVLLYPANYDASRKYPMLVYPYERLSQTLHQYIPPSERSYYNTNVWAANGYFVLRPDIVFRGRDPGISVLEALEPAVRAVVARGLVDSTKVGLVGHSWGGYHATFVPTRTNMFAASVAGAPITNFLSFAGAVHWTPGIAEFDHWETGQARMDVPFWEDMDAYLRNSPAAKVHQLRTPMLMMFGDADGTVDWHQGIEFYNFARRAGRDDFVMLVYPGEDHGLRKKENQIDYHRRILQWFGHWLKGEPAPTWMTEGLTWGDRKMQLDASK
ncbi:MAG TPA: prolyl oligopeptidase family serine peptidase [Gemmatimonadaceae bacterium]|jgi:dipeptidyl aminopeptidase/acylaminoacyl peptidase|nr:prolyl oligopeptidase family serine peptidase [Gemmatimonadaceae bacterium]